MVTNPDQKSQITYNGWPLFAFSKDTKAGDQTGEGVAGRWHVASTDLAPNFRRRDEKRRRRPASNLRHSPLPATEDERASEAAIPRPSLPGEGPAPAAIGDAGPSVGQVSGVDLETAHRPELSRHRSSPMGSGPISRGM